MVAYKYKLGDRFSCVCITELKESPVEENAWLWGRRPAPRARLGGGWVTPGSRVHLGTALPALLASLRGSSSVSLVLLTGMLTDCKDEGVNCVEIVNFNLINVLKFTILLIYYYLSHFF